MELLTNLHSQAAKKVFRYLQGTTDFGVFYKKGEVSRLVEFTDSDYVGDLNDRSTSCSVFMMSSGIVS
jgi:hypothetical protein